MSTSDSVAPARRGRGRRPEVEVRADVLAAAAELLFDQGVRATTFDRVAERAGVSRTTLYKYWSGPGVLAVEAYFARVEAELAFPDTGDIAADLRAQLHAFVRLMSEQAAGTVIAELIGAAQLDPELREAFAQRYGRPRRDLAVDALAVAQSRGQIRTDVVLELVVDELWGALYHRILLLGAPLTTELADRLLEQVLRGIATAVPS